MNASNILLIVTYVTAGSILVLGVIILTGFLLPTYIAVNFRIMMGIMMIVYGSYRIVIITIRNRRKDETEE
ncbi:MAG: hypothetical protein HZB59_00970 [Ignavibacteriales bacterium]|nr:hypothetical protein [Ignavibacteriales bacterium]